MRTLAEKLILNTKTKATFTIPQILMPSNRKPDVVHRKGVSSFKGK
jgi:hypothetical protein